MTPYWVHPEEVDEAWQTVGPWIANAVSRGADYTAEDIRQKCRENLFQLWCVINLKGDVTAVVVTAITETPRRKACQILIATGLGRRDWQHMISEIETWAKQNGCNVMKPIARKGWSRVLAPLGYRLTHVVLEKDL